MGNRRLTLAFPPFALSPQSSKKYYHDQWGDFREDLRSKFRRNTDIRFRGPEILEMDLQDWMNADHFPPLSSSQKNTTAAFGLPKHSQPDDQTRVERLRHQKIPPIAVIDSNSIAVSNLPLKFSWISKEQEINEDCIRSTDQILKKLRPPMMNQKQLTEQSAQRTGEGAKTRVEQQTLTVEEKGKWVGPKKSS